jgi:hypothetical protein
MPPVRRFIRLLNARAALLFVLTVLPGGAAHPTKIGSS